MTEEDREANAETVVARNTKSLKTKRYLER